MINENLINKPHQMLEARNNCLSIKRSYQFRSFTLFQLEEIFTCVCIWSCCFEKFPDSSLLLWNSINFSAFFNILWYNRQNKQSKHFERLSSRSIKDIKITYRSLSFVSIKIFMILKCFVWSFCNHERFFLQAILLFDVSKQNLFKLYCL